MDFDAVFALRGEYLSHPFASFDVSQVMALNLFILIQFKGNDLELVFLLAPGVRILQIVGKLERCRLYFGHGGPL